jgi:hypothetical protein
MNPSQSTITLTFGDSAENHVGMEQLGRRVEAGEGFTVEELVSMKTTFDERGLLSELIHLNTGIPELPPAAVLILRGGVDILLEDSGYKAEDLFAEQAALDVDKKAFMYGRVVNKSARWNLCFDDVSREPKYEEGRGRIIGFDKVSITRKLYENLGRLFGHKALGLKGEGNYYYDLRKCGIGFHGDSERRKVIGVRLGAPIPLHYQWFKEGAPIGERIIVPLNGGDVYVMSEKAVGTDWKSKKIPTLRHATGASKYTTI